MSYLDAQLQRQFGVLQHHLRQLGYSRLPLIGFRLGSQRCTISIIYARERQEDLCSELIEVMDYVHELEGRMEEIYPTWYDTFDIFLYLQSYDYHVICHNLYSFQITSQFIVFNGDTHLDSMILATLQFELFYIQRNYWDGSIVSSRVLEERLSYLFGAFLPFHRLVSWICFWVLHSFGPWFAIKTFGNCFFSQR